MLCWVLTTTPDSELTISKSNCHKSQGGETKIKSSFTLFVSSTVAMETLSLCVEVMKPLSPFRLSCTPRRPQASDSCSWLGAELKVGRPSRYHQNSFHRVTARPPRSPPPSPNTHTCTTSSSVSVSSTWARVSGPRGKGQRHEEVHHSQVSGRLLRRADEGAEGWCWCWRGGPRLLCVSSCH